MTFSIGLQLIISVNSKAEKADQVREMSYVEGNTDVPKSQIWKDTNYSIIKNENVILSLHIVSFVSRADLLRLQ